MYKIRYTIFNLNFVHCIKLYFFSTAKPQLSKQFPNVSSESDLQKYKTTHSHDRKSPSLSNPTDSGKQKVQIFAIAYLMILPIFEFITVFNTR